MQSLGKSNGQFAYVLVAERWNRRRLPCNGFKRYSTKMYYDERNKNYKSSLISPMIVIFLPDKVERNLHSAFFPNVSTNISDTAILTHFPYHKTYDYS